ncbi:MAG: biotin/lipoyl-binding protein, partial [Opitutus sp.]
MNNASRPPLKLLFAAPLLAALALTTGCGGSKAAAGGGGAPAVPVQVALAVQQDVPRRVESIGTVQAQRSVTVKSQVDGIIAQVNLKEGEDVQQGDLLVTLDRRPFENGLRVARADLANARAMAEQAQADLDRYQRLNDQAAISKEEYVQYTTKAETTR